MMQAKERAAIDRGQKQGKSMARLVETLEAAGVRVVQLFECVDNVVPLPTIVFNGEDNEGSRVIDISIENGYSGGCLSKEWYLKAAPQWIVEITIDGTT